VRSYYLHSVEDFDAHKQNIIDECKLRNGRAYIDLNVKDIEKVALLALKKTADLIYNKQYDAVKNVYEHACGNAGGFKQDKLWMVDIDTREKQTLDKVLQQLENLESNVRLVLPSKHGVHVLMTPFPLNKFSDIEDVSILKQGMPILYACV
jgi:hypothetical protein